MRTLTCIMLVLTALLALSCRSGNKVIIPVDQSGTFFGETQPVGDGHVRSFVTTNADGLPVALGVRISEGALDNLPTEGEHHETVLMLPAGYPVAPFNHITLDYAPFGHPPPGIYDVPHFDLHFYMMSQAERAGIIPDDPKFAVEPPAGLVPAGYMGLPGGVPGMGAHYGQDGPEFHGEPFTHAFIYGFYDGRMNFLEPMVAASFLAAKQPADAPIAQPQVYSQTGYYPTRYQVEWNETTSEWIVRLSGLTHRTAE